MFIDIKFGTTRMVILTPWHAFKVARLLPLRVFEVAFCSVSKRFLDRRKPMELTTERMKVHTSSFKRQLQHHTFLGLKANRAEAKYWLETKNAHCMPVLKVLLGGYIIVQPRAEPMTQAQLFRSSARRLTDDPELQNAKQFGWYKGEPRVLDFAHWGDPTLLQHA